MNKILTETFKAILALTLPWLKQLIASMAVPVLKRKAYEIIDKRVNKLITDLAQNAGKIKDEENSTKRLAYIEGTKLGIATIRALAEKLNRAADEIEKAVE